MVVDADSKDQAQKSCRRRIGPSADRPAQRLDSEIDGIPGALGLTAKDPPPSAASGFIMA
jgi:hypothetical protein